MTFCILIFKVFQSISLDYMNIHIWWIHIYFVVLLAVFDHKMGKIVCGMRKEEKNNKNKCITQSYFVKVIWYNKCFFFHVRQRFVAVCACVCVCGDEIAIDGFSTKQWDFSHLTLSSCQCNQVSTRQFYALVQIILHCHHLNSYLCRYFIEQIDNWSLIITSHRYRMGKREETNTFNWMSEKYKAGTLFMSLRVNQKKNCVCWKHQIESNTSILNQWEYGSGIDEQ